MADETKKYLVNIESNLKKYADEAAEAKKKVDELAASNKALKDSGTASTAEIEANNAALRNAQKEYTQAKKMVDLQTAANNSETGSRKQLSEILKLQQQELGKLGNAYTKDAQGIMRLNPLYTEQRNRIAATQKAIIDYDQALNDGRSNVGRYGEAVRSAFADAGKSVLSMLSPLALVAAAIAVGKKLFEGIKDAVMSTTFAIDVMNKAGAVTKQLFYDLAINGNINIKSLIEASKAQEILNKLRVEEGFDQLEISKINREEQNIRDRAIDRTRTHTERLADFNKVVELEKQKTAILVGHLQSELKAKEDLFKQQPANEKLALSILAIRAKINDTYAAEDVAMRRVTGQRTAFIQEEIDARKKLMEGWNKEIETENTDQLKLQELLAKGDFAKQKQYLKDKLDYELNFTDLSDTQKKIKRVEFNNAIAEIDKKAAKEKEDAEKAMIDAKGKLNKEIADYKKFISDQQKIDADALAKKKQDKLDHDEWVRNRDLTNEENIIARKEALNQWLYTTERERLGIQYQDEIANAEKTGADVNIIKGKYSALNRQIDEAEMNAKLELASGFTGSLATLLGEQTAIGKAAAIATTTIDTYVAAQKAYKTNMDIPPAPVWGIVAAAAAVVAGLSRVRQIMAISTNVKSGSSSVPTSISSSAPAQKTYATGVGSSVLTQAQLSQQQLNAMPNQNLLTADDIATAISKLPAPVVTVEDFNVKAKSMTKVSVRANI
jgi:hypothetical protein